jgi:hypothetical protein
VGGLLAPTGCVIAIPVPVPPDDAGQRFCAVVVRFDGQRLGRFMASVAAGRTSISIAQRLPLTQVGRAHQLTEAGGLGGKIVLQPD